MNATLPVVRLKFNPNHIPSGEDGGRFTTGDGGGSDASSSVYFEVAPDPNNAELTARWDKLSDEEKLAISRRVAGKMTPKVLDAATLAGALQEQIGGYEGKTNPSFAINVQKGQSSEKLIPAANLLGHALNQDSMMVVSASNFKGSDKVGIVTVDLGRGASMRDVSKTYTRLWELEDGGQKLVGGHSTANGHMTIINFSKLSNEEFANRIDKQLGGARAVSVHEAFVAFPQKADYGKNLPAGYTISEGASARNGGANRIRGEASAQLEAELVRLGKGFKFNPNHRPAGSSEGGEFAPDGDSGSGTATADRSGDEPPHYGEPIPGAISILATHYGNSETETLTGTHYGKGLRGAESSRVNDPSADPRIRERIYFYVDEGHGVVPESGVGSHRSTVHLDNMYDPSKDGATIWRQGKGDANASEAAIINAGFDGYYVRGFANRAGVAVVLGNHSVPVRLEPKPKKDVGPRFRSVPRQVSYLYHPTFKFNPNHQPPGSPEGGEFASGGGGGSSGIEGLPASVSLEDPSLLSVREALERKAFDIKAEKKEYGYDLTIMPNDIPADWKISPRGEAYDPKYFRVDPEFNRTVVIDRASFDYPSPSRESGIVYRGMSYEEYQGAKSSGYMSSRGRYNLGEDQRGVTYFSTDIEQAAHYASGFAPWQYQPTPTRPAVVVAIRDPGSHVKVPGTGETEVGLRGKIPMSQVVRVTLGHPISARPGWLEIHEDRWAGGPKGAKYTMGSASGMGVSVTWKDEKEPKSLPAVSLKYNPNHEPAGSPIGGEFASNDGGAVESRMAEKIGLSKDSSGKYVVTDQAAFDAAVEEYNKHPDTLGGKILNTDIARELSADYLKDRTLSAAVHEPASAFIKLLYAQKLTTGPNEGEQHLVMFTAGGTGAGKSTGLSLPEIGAEASIAHIIYDTNMNSFASADQKVSQAIAAGNQVAIVYVHRDPVDAFVNGALPRAVHQERRFGSGRTVPIQEHVKTHEGALETVKEIYAKYESSGKITAIGVDNSLGKGKARVEPLAKLSPKTYPDLSRTLHETLDQTFNSGKISAAIYQGFGRLRHPKVGEGHGRGHGKSDQSQGERRVVLRHKFNPEHEPGGSPIGGEFASASGPLAHGVAIDAAAATAQVKLTRKGRTYEVVGTPAQFAAFRAALEKSGTAQMTATGTGDNFSWNNSTLKASGRFSFAGDEMGSAKPPAPGERFTVFRLGSVSGDLSNRNAGNANGVATHIARMQDSEGPVGKVGSGNTVTAHEVVLSKEFGKYTGFIAGGAGAAQADSVGRVVTGKDANQIAYSFPKGGAYRSTLVGTVSLSKLSNFDDIGSNAGAIELRNAFYSPHPIKYTFARRLKKSSLIRVSLLSSAGKFNPNHVQTGVDGGQFTSGDDAGSLNPADFLEGDKTAVEQSLAAAKAYMREHINQDVADVLGDELYEKSAAWRAYSELDTERGSMSAKERSRAVASDLLSIWSITSSDSSNVSLLIQDVAEKEFGLQGIRRAADNSVEAQNRRALTMDEMAERIGGKGNEKTIIGGYHAFAREMYSQTQASLASAGIKEVYLVRGTNKLKAALPVGVHDLTMNALSSFTTDVDTAAAFGGLGSKYAGTSRNVWIRVPASRIFSTSRTGFGVFRESEFVILGGKTKAVVTQTTTAARSRESLREALRPTPPPKGLVVTLKSGAAALDNLDEDLENADWVKKTWNLPPYKSAEFLRLVPDLVKFRKLPVYKWAVEKGLIVNDEWAGKKVKFNPNHVQTGVDGGQFTSGDGGPEAARTVVVGHGTKRTLAEYEAIQKAAVAELDHIGMSDQKLEFRFGEGVSIDVLQPVMPGAKEGGHFDPHDGRIMVNLDYFDKENIGHAIRHEAFHARFQYATKSSAVEVGTYIRKNLEQLRGEVSMPNSRVNRISAYATAWWSRASTDVTVEKYTSAVNESLAEIHAYGLPLGGYPAYQQLDKIVSDKWAKRKH